jgi:hypothetical protein
MRPGGRLGLQNRMRARLRGPGWVRFPCTPAIRLFLIERREGSSFRSARLSHDVTFVSSAKLVTLSVVILFAAASIAPAQDTTTAIAQPAVADTLKPPISPKRAFLRSLLFPGSAQNTLGRHKVAAGIIAVEAMSIAMIRESGADVREARRQLGDSLVISYVDDNGNKLGTPIVERRRFGDDEVSSRRSHVEDWIALLVANHLFAASEAFVAASLWDVNARVTVSGNRSNLLIGARVAW